MNFKKSMRMNFTKTFLLAACVVAATNNELKADVTGAVVVGVVAGYAYEKVLYHLPILLSLPGICIVGTGHAFANCVVSNGPRFDYDKACGVSGLTALATMILFFMCEKEKTVIRKEEHVVVVHTPYPQYMPNPNPAGQNGRQPEGR